MNAPERAAVAAIVAGRAIAAAARREWIVVVRHTGESSSGAGWIERAHVVLSSMPPDADDLVPEGEELLRVEVMPADRLETLPVPLRRDHCSKYRALLMARRARAVGKRVDELVSWVDFDCISIDGAMERWGSGRA